MTELSDLTLLLYAARALDPPDAAEVAERLEDSPALRARLAALTPAAPAAAPVAEAAAAPPLRWRLPPPGMGRPIWEAPRAMLSPDRPAPGLRVALEDHPDADRRWVVLLAREGGEWRVLSPTAPAEARRLSALPLEDGARVLSLPRRPGGRLAVALPTEAADWAAPEEGRWRSLQEGLAAGLVTVSVFLTDDKR